MTVSVKKDQLCLIEASWAQCYHAFALPTFTTDIGLNNKQDDHTMRFSVLIGSGFMFVYFNFNENASETAKNGLEAILANPRYTALFVRSIQAGTVALEFKALTSEKLPTELFSLIIGLKLFTQKGIINLHTSIEEDREKICFDRLSFLIDYQLPIQQLSQMANVNLSSLILGAIELEGYTQQIGVPLKFIFEKGASSAAGMEIIKSIGKKIHTYLEANVSHAQHVTLGSGIIASVFKPIIVDTPALIELKPAEALTLNWTLLKAIREEMERVITSKPNLNTLRAEFETIITSSEYTDLCNETVRKILQKFIDEGTVTTTYVFFAPTTDVPFANQQTIMDYIKDKYASVQLFECFENPHRMKKDYGSTL